MPASCGPAALHCARELLDSVPRLADAVFRAVSSSVLLLDDRRDELVFCSVSNPAEGGLIGQRFPAEVGISGWVAETGETLIVESVAYVDIFARDVAEATGYVPEGIMAAPLTHGGRTLGVLEVLDPSPQHWSTAGRRELLSLLARQAALSLYALNTFSSTGMEEMILMAFDSLDALRSAGHPVDSLSERQQDVLRSLSEDEVAVLNSVMCRLAAAAGDVEAQEIKLL